MVSLVLFSFLWSQQSPNVLFFFLTTTTGQENAWKVNEQSIVYLEDI